MKLHYAAGGGIDSNGQYSAGQAGFNLADVQSVDQLNALPDGVKGLVWLDQGAGVTQSFIDAVTPYIGNSKLEGFYLKDEPDPTGKYGTLVTAADLKAESDWIHANVPGATTFITMMDMGSSTNPNFTNTYNPANTGIDYFGIDPYPVRSGTGQVDYSMIDKAVAAAVQSGIPIDKIVPVYQAFGGGGWVNDQGGQYVVPTAQQEQNIINEWAKVVPSPAFDYAYAWNSQNGDTALENSAELQQVFLAHNTASSGSSGNVLTPPSTVIDPVAPATSGAADSSHTASSGSTGTVLTPPSTVIDPSAPATSGAADSSHTASSGSSGTVLTPPSTVIDPSAPATSGAADSSHTASSGSSGTVLTPPSTVTDPSAPATSGAADSSHTASSGSTGTVVTPPSTVTQPTAPSSPDSDDDGNSGHHNYWTAQQGGQHDVAAASDSFHFNQFAQSQQHWDHWG